jgi:hypothetical protein
LLFYSAAIACGLSHVRRCVAAISCTDPKESFCDTSHNITLYTTKSLNADGIALSSNPRHTALILLPQWHAHKESSNLHRVEYSTRPTEFGSLKHCFSSCRFESVNASPRKLLNLPDSHRTECILGDQLEPGAQIRPSLFSLSSHGR